MIKSKTFNHVLAVMLVVKSRVECRVFLKM